MKSGLVSRGTPQAVRAEQGAIAYEMILRGCTYKQISAELGVAEGTVAKRLQEAARNRVDPLVDHYRDVECDRLDRLLLSLEKGLKAGDVASINSAVRISERRSKLLGLDAPERVDVALSRARESAAELLHDALGEALGAVLTAARPNPRWVAELRSYGEQVAAWALMGREGERPAAPAPPPEDDPVEPGVLEPSAVIPSRSGGADLDSALSAFESEFGPLYP